jgi:hypothetical protein
MQNCISSKENAHMATRLPIDATAFALIATGKHRPVSEYGELADGSRRAIPNSQAKLDGVPLWTVDVLLDDEESDRAQTVGVKVASVTEPNLPKYQPVHFVSLTCMPYVDRRTNRVALSFSASGIANAAPAPSGRKGSGNSEG